MTDQARINIGVLRASQDRLAALLGGLDADAATGPSYCSDWTIAQVCSHLGSGAELQMSFLEAALAHAEPAPVESFQPVWAKWDARPPSEQISECIAVNEAHVEAFEALSDAQLADAHIALFGVMELDGGGLARFRLGEHAVHSWDIAVALDATARVAGDAVEILIDVVPELVGFFGKPQGGEWDLLVRGTDPTRTFLLGSHDAITLAPIDPDSAPATDGELQLPSEALLRLTYGRLDAAHADGVVLSSDKVALDDVRATFPGI